MSGGVSSDDLLDRDVGAGHKAYKANQADDGVLHHHPVGDALIVEGEQLQERRDDEGQSAAADGAH